jgi:hypothetical protein
MTSFTPETRLAGAALARLRSELATALAWEDARRRALAELATYGARGLDELGVAPGDAPTLARHHADLLGHGRPRAFYRAVARALRAGHAG